MYPPSPTHPPITLTSVSPPSHLLTLLLQLREYELEREFPGGRENKVKSGASKYNNGLDDQKYKYNIGLDDSGLSNEVVEFVPLIVPEKKKQKSVAHPEKREHKSVAHSRKSVSHHLSNEIPLLPVSNRRIDFGKSSPSKGFRGSSSTRFNKGGLEMWVALVPTGYAPTK